MSGSSPENIKILLCGRTGSGKSSIANMLVKSHLNPPLLFPTSSGVRGKTISCQREESREFVVVDTVGLGEAEHGSVMDDEARNMLYDFFVKISQESYNYFAYVHKWGKLDHLDGELWAFFQKAFVGAERNFVIIFTHCSPKALEENLEDIMGAFEGCERYIPVDFPAASKPEASSSVRTRRNDKLRTDSLLILQESLATSVPDLTSNSRLRSNLKKGRVLLMGSNVRARNMIAEMLVNGTKKMSTSSASSSHCSSLSGDVGNLDRQPKSALFEELEGRRWQVVNASVFDKERIGDIYTDVGSEEEAIRVASSAVTMLASEFLTILRHGAYSHFIYVEEYGNKPPEWEPVLREITKVLSIKQWVRRAVAVLVNPNSNNISSEIPNRFGKWGRECQVLLPLDSESLGVESKNQVIRQRDLGIIEEALDATVPYGAWGSISNASGLRVNPNAFEELVWTFRGLEKFPKAIMSEIWNSERQDDCVDTSTSRSTIASIWKSHVKHVAAEIKLERKRYPFLRIEISEGLVFREVYWKDFKWGELQIVDEHHANKTDTRIPLFIDDCDASIGTWTISSPTFLAHGDIEHCELELDCTIILWINPHPRPLCLEDHIDKFMVRLSWLNSN
ncbi:hypothetical protein KC19_3G143100 [Ceratodon purpureus]|uniref:AIG1-type G domain-containing protein n=1 Tax=Ceratodon purpureus TaxID=3225 RepID=A0A8T0IKX8_CERPU|nr:hypothetical protein KC19_3G143100 [Ceratodon purpureus]